MAVLPVADAPETDMASSALILAAEVILIELESAVVEAVMEVVSTVLLSSLGVICEFCMDVWSSESVRM